MLTQSRHEQLALPVGGKTPIGESERLTIGGNDIIGHAGANQFRKDLDALAREVCDSRRQVVMLELPLFPFDNAYGIQQRRIAAQYKFTLIPRRYFAEVLAAPDAKLDGIHLSAVGQRRMAEMVWGFVGQSLEINGAQ